MYIIYFCTISIYQYTEKQLTDLLADRRLMIRQPTLQHCHQGMKPAQ